MLKARHHYVSICTLLARWFFLPGQREDPLIAAGGYRRREDQVIAVKNESLIIVPREDSIRLRVGRWVQLGLLRPFDSPNEFHSEPEGLALRLPIVMTVSTFLAVVSYFEANAIGVSEERGPVIGRVLWIELRFRCFDTSRTKLIGNGDNIGD